MAGNNLSPRQKMINLMYLVLIAMLALNMSKEVLSAFGLMEEKFADANALATEANEKTLAGLKMKAEEKPEEFQASAAKAEQITQLSNKFYLYLESLKREVLQGSKFEIDPETGKLPYQQMDKGDYIDEAWFAGDNLSPKGKEFTDAIKKYQEDVKKILGDDVKYKKAIETLGKKFNTEDIKAKDGAKKLWLDYHFKGFPTIASITKLTAIQNDVKRTEANMFNLFLGNTLDEATSLKNYQAIVLADKSAFFAGETFKGKVVLGKYANVKPTKLSVQGKSIDLNAPKAIDSSGAARLTFNVGNVGEHKINGKFTFLEDGKDLQIPIVGNYVVVPRPKSATISADKMNVVYRGVPNPMTISFAGVPANKVNASAPGLKKGSGAGKYIMRPASGKEIVIKVSATLDDGSKVSDKKKFRIKDIPKPEGVIAGQSGEAKLPRNNVSIGKVSARFADFDFDLPLRVTSFKIKVPGQPSVTVSGSKMNSQAQNALRKAKRGASVSIFDIKAKAAGGGPKIKTASPIVITLTN